jgi:predicted DNA-binding protein
MKTQGRQAKDIQAMSLRVPRETYEALRALSFATETSINELVCRAIGDFLAEAGHQEAVDAMARRFTEQYRVALDKLADL